MPILGGGGSGGPVDWEEVLGKPSTYPAASHAHAIDGVTGLQSALDGKAASGHAHIGVYEPANAAIALHLAAAHAPSTAQKNSDILQAEIEAKLIGVIASHSHAGGADPFATFIGALAADVSTAANTTPVSATGLVFSYAALTTYFVEVVGRIAAPAATTGVGFQFDFSSVIDHSGFTFFHQLANTGTLAGGNSIADDASAGVSSGISANAAIVPFYGAGVIRTGALTGTAQLRFRSEVAAVATLKAFTVMRVHRIA